MDATTDQLGQTIKAGDRVAVAFRSGNVAELRTGTVVGFGEAKSYPRDEPTMIVDWDPQVGYSVKQSGIWISRKAFVRLA